MSTFMAVFVKPHHNHIIAIIFLFVILNKVQYYMNIGYILVSKFIVFYNFTKPRSNIETITFI